MISGVHTMGMLTCQGIVVDDDDTMMCRKRKEELDASSSFLFW